MDVRALLAEGRLQLAGQAAAALEAEILLGVVLGVNRAWLYANTEHLPGTEAEASYRKFIERRKNGEPIAYLAGKREFWSLPLRVTPDVLIPRPETELLVETALAFIPVDAAWRIADLGTGSGAIALALASERPLCEVHATEISGKALQVARGNEQCIAPQRVHFHLGSWLQPLQGKFQLLVSNPPYVAANDPHLVQGDCRFEPAGALSPGSDALAAIRYIATEALRFLARGGMLAFEHGIEQGEESRQLLAGLGYENVSTENDLEDRPRVTSGIRA